MSETIRERWMKLCDQARQEMDSAKLMDLVRQINALMDEEERSERESCNQRERSSSAERRRAA